MGAQRALGWRPTSLAEVDTSLIGLVERVTRQVQSNKSHASQLEAQTKAYLKAGDRATAAKFALELQKAKAELATNEGQLQMHETSYGNNGIIDGGTLNTLLGASNDMLTDLQTAGSPLQVWHRPKNGGGGSSSDVVQALMTGATTWLKSRRT